MLENLGFLALDLELFESSISESLDPIVLLIEGVEGAGGVEVDLKTNFSCIGSLLREGLLDFLMVLSVI